MFQENPKHANSNRQYARRMVIGPAQTADGPGTHVAYGRFHLYFTAAETLDLTNRLIDALEQHEQEN